MESNSSTLWPTPIKTGTALCVAGAVLIQACQLSASGRPQPWLHAAQVAAMLLAGLGVFINLTYYWRHDRPLFARKAVLLGAGAVVAVGAYVAINGWPLAK